MNTQFANKPTSIIQFSSGVIHAAAGICLCLIKEGMLSHAAFIATQISCLALSALSLSAFVTAFTLSNLIQKRALPQLQTQKDFYKAFALSVIPITGVVIGTLKIAIAIMTLPIAVAVIAKVALGLGVLALSSLAIYGLPRLIIYGLINCCMPESPEAKRERLLTNARKEAALTSNLN